MRHLILAMLLTSCAGPLESMAWKVDCAKDTPESLHERYEYENRYYLCSEYETLDMCTPIWVHRYRYEWAKKYFRDHCERPA